MTHKPTAIVIDDDHALADAIAAALIFAGFEVKTITDPTAALRQIIADSPALVTLDMQMPKLNGVELLAQIRADSRLQHVKVMMISASSQLLNESAFDAADVILMKPVSIKQIMNIAQRLVQATPADDAIPKP